MNTPTRFLGYIMLLCFLMISANQCYISSLSFVFPSTAGAVMATLPAYIYVLSLLCIKGTKCLFLNTLAVGIAIAGNLMIVLQK